MDKVYFEVAVYGEYFARKGDKTELRGYEAVFRLPNANAPLGVIKGKLLKPFLLKKDPHYDGIHTHHISEISCHGRKLEPNEIPVRFQSKEQLRNYVTYHQLGINVDDYGSVGLLRDHVRRAKEEPEAFPKVQADYASKQKADKELHDLNEEVLGVTHKPVAPSQGGQRIKNEEPKAEEPKYVPEPQAVPIPEKTKVRGNKRRRASQKKANPDVSTSSPATADGGGSGDLLS